MAEELTFISGSKEEQYLSLLPQVRSLIEGEVDLVANLANVAAALKEAFDFFWVGFYLVKQDQLVLGPFQGPVACTRIRKGKGVCGTAWQEGPRCWCRMWKFFRDILLAVRYPDRK